MKRSTLGDGSLRAARGLAPLAVINSLVMRVCCVGLRIQTLCQMVSCSFSDPKVHSSPRAEREGKRKSERSWNSVTKDSKVLTFTQRHKIVFCSGEHTNPTLSASKKEALVASSDSNNKITQTNKNRRYLGQQVQELNLSTK